MIGDDRALHVSKRAGDVAWRGTETDEEQKPVVCWDNRDIFGDYGGGSPGLPVHFVMFAAPSSVNEDEVLVAHAQLARDVDPWLFAQQPSRATWTRGRG